MNRLRVSATLANGPDEDNQEWESLAMLKNEKILITGATGAIALPMARYLAPHNEVWGMARFQDETLRARLDDAGVKTVPIDLSTPDLSTLPDDFSYVLHYAYTRRPSGEFHQAIQINAIGTGLVLQKCRKAKAALVVSAATLYSAHEDPFHAYKEEDDIGHVVAPWAASSPVSKVTIEAVARFCAEAFDLPTVILRPSVPYGCEVDMFTSIQDAILAGRPFPAAYDPQPFTPIHIDDMLDQVEALLASASTPATILNWGSDEVVSVQDHAALVGELSGKPAEVNVFEMPGAARGAVIDTSRIRALVGPCKRIYGEEAPRLIQAAIDASA